ncbi:kinetochore protein NDC80 homolog [Oryza glaberrima]|uniref:Kinetochore protein NDC80 n=1 Tax=Oryza glaberrima TaxID=4538 RepID=I1QJE0_ORYGL|nr:kinetochore protein NDC80 homolog [Oryza glaberrima]
MRRGGGGGGRRLPKSSLAPSAASDRTPLLDPHVLHPRNLDFAFSRRDSDAASLCSSRPSSIGTGPSFAAPVTNFSDRASQAAALRVVNAYLAPAVSLRPPLPSAKDIVAAFRHLFECLDFPLHGAFEDDLLFVLRVLRCPFKLTRSALKAPGTPHSWPPLLSVLYWLTLLVNSSESGAGGDDSPAASNDLMLYITNSYSLFISGDDDSVASLDEEYSSKARAHAQAAVEASQALEKEALDLESKRTKLTSGPSRLEALQAEKEALTADVEKFEAVVKSWTVKIQEKEESSVHLEKELEAKLMDQQRIAAENEELMKKVDAQVVNVRDVDRMQREIQSVERDNVKLENGNATLEEKGWELEAAVVGKLEEIEGLVEQCNQALRKLKPGIDFQYMLNTKASSPVELLGTSYKTIMKPALNSLADEARRISILKHDESVELEKQSQRNAKILSEKKNHISFCQTKTDEMVARLDSLDVEIGNHVSRCKADARLMKDELEKKDHHLSTVEKESEEFLKISEKKLEDAKRETDEEIQMCARELLKLIDSVTEYKEFMETSISGMRKDLYETVDDISSLASKAASTRQTSAQFVM